MRSTLPIQRDAAQAREQILRDSEGDGRIHTSLHALVRLQHFARDFSFLPRQPVHSLLSGKHASRIRGRGLNFEEIRAYHAGDDIRTIDWKVTARLRSPHTRVFTEERDRPTLLVVDQRIGMFFGTKVNMKSVTAAEVAALAAWRIQGAGDRVGAIVFNDEVTESVTPGRSRAKVMQVLNLVVGQNQQLSADSPSRGNAGQFNVALEQAARLASHDFLVVVISDFHGFDETSKRILQQIRWHNDLIAALVHDPMASALPDSQHFIVTDGELQIELPSSRKEVERLQETTSGRIADVLDFQSRLQAPVLPLSTAEPTALQLKRLFGRRV